VYGRDIGYLPSVIRVREPPHRVLEVLLPDRSRHGSFRESRVDVGVEGGLAAFASGLWESDECMLVMGVR